jgi:hypothetical protein
MYKFCSWVILYIDIWFDFLRPLCLQIFSLFLKVRSRHFLSYIYFTGGFLFDVQIINAMFQWTMNHRKDVKWKYSHLFFSFLFHVHCNIMHCTCIDMFTILCLSVYNDENCKCSMYLMLLIDMWNLLIIWCHIPSHLHQNQVWCYQDLTICTNKFL